MKLHVITSKRITAHQSRLRADLKREDVPLQLIVGPHGQPCMNQKANIAVIILAYDSAIHLPRALEHIRDVVQEIFVIDSFSTDNVELAKAGGAQWSAPADS